MNGWMPRDLDFFLASVKKVSKRQTERSFMVIFLCSKFSRQGKKRAKISFTWWRLHAWKAKRKQFILCIQVDFIVILKYI
jgi:hypothetical protein